MQVFNVLAAEELLTSEYWSHALVKGLILPELEDTHSMQHDQSRKDGRNPAIYQVNEH